MICDALMHILENARNFNVKTSFRLKLKLNATIELTTNNINRQQRKQRINATICGFVRENSTPPIHNPQSTRVFRPI